MGGSAAHSIQAQAQHIWAYFTLRAGFDRTGVVERCDEGWEMCGSIKSQL